SISSEKTQILAELEKIKEERQHIEEECLELKAELKKIVEERDTLAGLINIMKVKWEKEYQNLQAKYQESELNITLLESRVMELQQEHVRTQSELYELRSSREVESEKLQAVENQKAALSKFFEDQQNGVQMMMKGIAAEREAWQRKETELVEQQLIIQETMKRKETEVDALRKELENVLADKRAIKQKLIDAGKENVEANGRIRELEAEKKRNENELAKLKNVEGKFSIQLGDSKKQIEKHKAQILTLTKKVAEAETEKRKIIQAFEKTMATTERNSVYLKNELDLMKQEKENLIRNKFHEKEKLMSKKFHGSSFLTQFGISEEPIIDGNDKIDILEQRVVELENSLKTSNLECDRLRETLADVQFKYLDTINDKDQLILTKRELDKKVKALNDQLEDVLAKNVELVTQMSSR
ncbi:13922_t:CDS:2, partial [Racocetra persica]